MSTEPLSQNLSASGRNNALDVLRALAIMLVMFNHLQYPQSSGSGLLGGINSLVLFIKKGGWIGVDMFFVLSGFLVSGLLFKEYQLRQKVNFKQFLIRRGFKLYPGFWAFLLLGYITAQVCMHFRLIDGRQMDMLGISTRWYRCMADAVFASNYTRGQWPHVWSLCVEEHFYILLTLLFYRLAKARKINYITLRNSYFITLAFCVLSRLAAALIEHGFDFDPQNIYTNSRLDALFMGVFLAYLYHFDNHRLNFINRRKALYCTLSLLYLAGNFFFERMGNLWQSFLSNSIHPLCFSIILIVALNSPMALFRSRLLAYMGRISYAVYLWHFFVNVYVLAVFPAVTLKPAYWLCYVIVYMALSVLFGVVFTALIEKPFLDLRNRYFPSNAGRKLDYQLYPDDARNIMPAATVQQGNR